VAEAEQQLADAQNRLYNIGLEGANDYTQKYQETMNEMYDTMTELQQQFLAGEIATQEEYDRKMLEAQEYYYQKLQNYSELYGIAVAGNSAAANEAWSSEFSGMMNKTEEWMLAVDDYTKKCGSAFVEWQGVVDKVNEVVGGDFTTLSNNVKSIVDESNNLATSITEDGGVLDAIGAEVDAVSGATTAYANKRQSILDLIKSNEDYIKSLNAVVAAEAGDANVGDTSSDADDSSGDSTAGDSDDTQGNGDSGEVDNSDKADGVAAALWMDGHLTSGWGNGEERAEKFAEKGVQEAEAILKSDARTGELYTRWKNKRSQLSNFYYGSFDTGGYTGEWGPEGKFAMLHQKEIVLNQTDTENLLAAVEMLRTILQTIDMHSMSA
jgi:hypothetical protein